MPDGSGHPPGSIYLGVTGASGAPYAVRLTEKLAELGVDLSLTISDTGIQVARHELGIAADDREGVCREFLRLARATATIFDPTDLAAPVSSGSAFPDAAVVCPCSLATAAHIAVGTSATLIHRAGAVALKERRPLVLMPREMPLSSVHLRRLLESSDAGAIIVPPMPAFYNRPNSLQDAIDFVVGKVLSVLGFRQDLYPSWGSE